MIRRPLPSCSNWQKRHTKRESRKHESVKGPTSNVFKKGHRIRVDLSSSNFPRFAVNPNTGEPLGQHRRLMVATNTVLHERAHPSHIVLPMITSAEASAN